MLNLLYGLRQMKAGGPEAQSDWVQPDAGQINIALRQLKCDGFKARQGA
jgi:hypothetical protein